MIWHASDAADRPGKFCRVHGFHLVNEKGARDRLHRIMAGGCELAVKPAEEALRENGKFARSRGAWDARQSISRRRQKKRRSPKRRPSALPMATQDQGLARQIGGAWGGSSVRQSINAAVRRSFPAVRRIFQEFSGIRAIAPNDNAGAAAGVNNPWKRRRYCRYCWMRVVRRPASPWRSIEYCQARNSSTVSV